MKTKKSLIVTFAAVAAISLGGALTVGKASAAPVELNADSTSVSIGGANYDLSTFQTYGKASVRLSATDPGIRFTSGIDGDVYSALTAADAASDDFAVTFGTIITYYSRVTAAGAFTMEALDAACAGHLPEGATAYVDCPAVYFLSDTYKQVATDTEYTAVLQVASGNYDYELCARAYLKVEEGAETTYYYAQYDATAKRTPAMVAQSALADYAKYADNLTSLGVLNGYMTAKSDGVAPENEFILPKTVDSTIETVEIGNKAGVTKFSQVNNANQWANRLETRFLAPSVTFGEVTASQRMQKLGLGYMTLEFYYNDNFNVNIPTAEGHKVVKLQGGTVTSDYEGWQNAFMVYDADGNYTTSLTKGAWYTAVMDISAGVKNTIAAPQVAICLLADNTTAYFANPTYYVTEKCFSGLNDFAGSTEELTLHLGETTAMGTVLCRGVEATEYDVTVADGSVATYANGAFTPVKVGETTATVFTATGSYTLTLKVTEAYVQAENADMFSVFKGFGEGSDGTYGAYANAVGGREGVYALTNSTSAANWNDNLAVTETNHATGEQGNKFAEMKEKGYAYVTFDVYFESGSGIYVYAPSETAGSNVSYHTGATFVAGWDNTITNTNISLTYNGLTYAKPVAGYWYTVVVKYVIPATQTSYATIQVNWRYGTGNVYFDNLRYYYNDSFLPTETDYVQKDGSEFEIVKIDGSFTQVGTSTVWTLTANTGWNTQLSLAETNGASGKLGMGHPAAGANMLERGYSYVVWSIRINSTSSFGINATTPNGRVTEKYVNNSYNSGDSDDIKIYDANGDAVTMLEDGVWYTVVVTYGYSGSGAADVGIASNSSGAIDVSLDNVRYYLNDSWKTDLNVKA